MLGQEEPGFVERGEEEVEDHIRSDWSIEKRVGLKVVPSLGRDPGVLGLV